MQNKKELLETLAALEHEQWMAWAQSIISEVSQERRDKWKDLFKHYDELPEKEKEKDRVFARKVMAAIPNQEPEKKFLKEIESDLKDYKRMTEHIDRLAAEMQHAGDGITQSYGDDAGMPRAGGKRDPVAREVIRRDRKWRQLKRLEDKVKRIDLAAAHIKDVKQMILLELLMEGRRINDICNQMRLSRSYVNEIKWALVKNLAKAVQQEEGKKREGNP